MRHLFVVSVLAAFIFAAMSCASGQASTEEEKATSEEAAKEEMQKDKEKMEAETKKAEEAAKKKAAESKKMAEEEAKKAKERGNIVEVATKAGSFNTLVSAIKAAELAETLSGDGPFTVFAPTDKAFKDLPDGTLESLLKPESKSKLQAILKYHVISGKVMAEDVESGEVKTLEGSKAMIEVTDEGVTYAGANVTQTDVKASNGVIHVIDKVVMPPKKKETAAR